MLCTALKSTCAPSSELYYQYQNCRESQDLIWSLVEHQLTQERSTHWWGDCCFVYLAIKNTEYCVYEKCTNLILYLFLIYGGAINNFFVSLSKYTSHQCKIFSCRPMTNCIQTVPNQKETQIFLWNLWNISYQTYSLCLDQGTGKHYIELPWHVHLNKTLMTVIQAVVSRHIWLIWCLII